MRLEKTLYISRPIGEITINGETQHNLFTDEGMRRLYQPGQHTIFNTTNGGLFRRLHVGDGIGELTRESTDLINPLGYTQSLSNVDITYHKMDGEDYAQFKATYTFQAGVIQGMITELMLTDNDNVMICGTTLQYPVEVDPDVPLVITYLIRMPIIPEIITLDRGTFVNGDVERDWTLEGRFHNASSTTLSSILPINSSGGTSGNQARVWVNGALRAAGHTYYASEAVFGDDTLTFTTVTKLLTVAGNVDIVNMNFANSTTSNTAVTSYPLRLVYANPLHKSSDWSLHIEFKLILEFM